MATHLTSAQILAAFRKWFVPFDVEPGWEKRSNGTGWGEPMVAGVMYHHTGDDASDARTVALLRDGRPGLSGPLCNFAALDTGRIRIISAGAANHAGKGDPDTLAIVRAAAAPYDREIHPDQSSASASSVGGNGKFYGWESAYGGGTDLTPNPLQHRVTLLSMAAIIDALTVKSTGRVMIGHREWTSAKPDPRAVNLGAARSDISWILAVGPAAALHWYQTGSKTLPAPTPTPNLSTAIDPEASMYVRLKSTDRALHAAVILTDGFTARWMNSAGWASHKAGIKAATGREPQVAEIATLDGLAVQWVGPIPPGGADKKPYPVPAGWPRS